MKPTSRECYICGKTFIAYHGSKRMCPECSEVILHHKRRNIPHLYDNPKDREAYEKDLKRRMTERHKDTIIADGYADRQMARTLERAGKIKTTL